MSDPKNIFSDIKALEIEKSELTARLMKFNAELQANSITNRRREVLKREVQKIIERFAQIKKLAKSRSYSYYEAYYRICNISLPKECRVELEFRATESLKNSVPLHEIKPVNIYSDEDLNLKQENKNLTSEKQNLKNLLINDTKKAQKIFIALNGRLTPDEASRFSETLSFLKETINRKI